MDSFDNDWKIQPSDWRINLIDAIDLILNFNKNKNKNENENENDETLMSSDKDDDKTTSQNEIKKLNDNLDEIIDKSKSFEEQIELLKKREDLKRPYKDFDDKELKSKYFKIKLADMSNDIDEKKFKQKCGQKLVKLANKLINKIDKEENQMIAKNINANKKKT